MYIDDFPLRLSQLRLQKGVSARDMSLSIGQNESYINTIENGKSLPSMQAFFYICEYLEIKPEEFFDTENSNPARLKDIIDDLKKLNNDELDSIARLVKSLAENKN